MADEAPAPDSKAGKLRAVVEEISAIVKAPLASAVKMPEGTVEKLAGFKKTLHRLALEPGEILDVCQQLEKLRANVFRPECNLFLRELLGELRTRAGKLEREARSAPRFK